MTYAVLFNFPVHGGTSKASTELAMSTNNVNVYKTIHTGAPWPWHDYRDGRWRLRDSHMTLQPSAHVKYCGIARRQRCQTS